MIEKKKFVSHDLETAAGASTQRTPTKTAISNLKKSIQGISELALSSETLAKKGSRLPGFEHLNPELLTAGFLFRSYTKRSALEKIPPKFRNRVMRKVITRIFPIVTDDVDKYARVKADLIRYLLLMEMNF